VNSSSKILSLLFCCSVSVNIYQYRQEGILSFAPEVKLNDEAINIKFADNLSSSKKIQEKGLARNISSSNSSSSINNDIKTNIEKIETDDNQVSEVTHSTYSKYQENVFEYELSLYLDDDIVNLVKNGKNEKEITDIIDMLSSNDVREQDIEFESKINLLFENYIDSIQSGSQYFRCNSSGCYISYVLTNDSEANHIFLDFPRIDGSTSSGYTLSHPDGTLRYVDFILIQ
jgi:hypothetical protein